MQETKKKILINWLTHSVHEAKYFLRSWWSNLRRFVGPRASSCEWPVGGPKDGRTCFSLLCADCTQFVFGEGTARLCHCCPEL
jgi:hypothetical protein